MAQDERKGAVLYKYMGGRLSFDVGDIKSELTDIVLLLHSDYPFFCKI